MEGGRGDISSTLGSSCSVSTFCLLESPIEDVEGGETKKEGDSFFTPTFL